MTHREILEALSGLMLVLFVAMISSTIVSTALPRVLGELNGTQTQYTWVWVSFVGNNFDWLSWQSAAFVVPGVAILAAAVRVEKRADHPVVPLDVVKKRIPALAIIASLAVGMAMFGASVFLGQYFQIGSGYTPTESGLLTIPMMAGVMIATTITGQLVTRTGKVKPYIVWGTVALVAGFLGLGFIDHQTPLWQVGAGMLLIGAGVGMGMQNLVLAVQNTASLRDLGAATGAVTFFRSLGGTIGVSVLGAVLATRVHASIASHMAAAGMPAGEGSGDSLNIGALPEAMQAMVRAAYGDATGHIFLISAGIGIVGPVAALLLPKIVLRTSLDLPRTEAPAPKPEPVLAGSAVTR